MAAAGDGTFSLYALGPPEDQGVLQAALRHRIEDRFRAKTGNPDDGGLDSYEQRAVDALFDILRTHVKRLVRTPDTLRDAGVVEA